MMLGESIYRKIDGYIYWRIRKTSYLPLIMAYDLTTYQILLYDSVQNNVLEIDEIR